VEKVTSRGFYMDGYLIQSLETFIYNLQDDWDAVILISGNGMVRVGKSVVAQQVGLYCAERLGTPFGIDNIVFTGDELMTTAVKLPPNSVLIYDEARGELDSKKIMEGITKKLLDFLNECGYLNHVLIFVLPDYFDLPKYVSVNRSNCLINVYAKKKRVTLRKAHNNVTEVNEYERGHFQFFDRDAKKKLYILGKKNYNDYDCVKSTFSGDFRKGYAIPEEVYKAKKAEHAARDREERTTSPDRMRFIAAVSALCTLVTHEQAAFLMKRHGFSVTRERVGQIDRASRPKEEGRRFINMPSEV
jgi:hypothetical protein